MKRKLTDTKRQAILNAAEEVMSKKGLIGASIAEIARKAKIADSVIYHYFKGKEDLLFSIPGTRVTEILSLLNNQLQGILDPVSKLGKMVWFHLDYNDTHLDYARLLLLECRSNKAFYEHNAYRSIRKYSGILLSILEDAIDKGFVRSNINIRIVRDMIFGLLDWEILNRVASEKVTETVSDFEDIMALILPMISSKPSQMKRRDKSSRLLESAEIVFAERGYTQATIVVIAKHAGVGEGTVYEYFRNKEDLLFAISEHRFNEHLDTFGEIFEIKNALRKLRRMVRYHFSYWLKHRHFLRIFSLHISLNNRFYRSEAFRVFEKYTAVYDPILDEGKSIGVFRSNVNNRVFKDLLFGSFSHLALRWLILEGNAKTDKTQEIDEVVLLLSLAVASDEAAKEYGVFR